MRFDSFIQALWEMLGKRTERVAERISGVLFAGVLAAVAASLIMVNI